MYNQPREGYQPGRYLMSPAQSVPTMQMQPCPPGTPVIRRQVPTLGSSNRPVYGGGHPYSMQMQQPQAQQPWIQHPQQVQGGYMTAPPYSTNRTRSTPPPQVQQSQVGGMMIPGGMKTYATAGIPPEIEANPNVQYVRMNWEDILGGKEGLQGLNVSMAPGNGDPNANRQIRIGLGGAQQSEDGSTPLRIVSFQPVDNYKGLKPPTTIQPGQPKFSVFTGTPSQGQGQGSDSGKQMYPYGNMSRR